MILLLNMASEFQMYLHRIEYYINISQSLSIEKRAPVKALSSVFSVNLFRRPAPAAGVRCDRAIDGNKRAIAAASLSSKGVGL